MRRMIIPTVVALILGSMSAQAELHDRGGGLIYDDVLNVTWLKNANQGAGSVYDDGADPSDGRMTWVNAQAWAENLVYGGFDDWRLPKSLDTDAPGCDFAYAGTDCGYNIDVSTGELAHLWYVTLGNKAAYDTTGNPLPGAGFVNHGPFLNAQAYFYWSDTEYAPNLGYAWDFDTFDGRQTYDDKSDWFYAWPVRTGDVTPPTLLSSLSLGSSLVAGCKSLAGTVTLSSPAPAGGVIVALTDTLEAASVPLTLTFAAGATSRSFTIKTKAVSLNEVGTVSAVLDGKTVSQSLTVRPMGLTWVTLTPSWVVGGQPVIGKATLECKAGPGPIKVDLSSNNPAVASPVAASIVVPQSLQSVNFDVTTNAVHVKSYATISVEANGITKSKKLTVNVAGAVSPTRLRFGSVTVGQSSAPLNATLTNKGALAFSVNSISVTGTAATWFAQSHDCPASLPAGASCTISVTFKPIAAASKSAKLSIATSATSTPLSVALSGTGI